MAEDLVIASNRGPMSFSYSPDGDLVAKQGAGGLVSSLAPLIEGTGATWVAAAITDADREAARAGLTEAEPFHYRVIDINPETYRRAYDVVSNEVLWFLNHRLFDLTNVPVFEAGWTDDWDAYRAVNRRFAEVIAEDAPDGAIVLVQDYHLNLVASSLSQLRPDLLAVHFTHTPFMDPVDLRVLPNAMATELMEGMAAFTACGFHTREWEASFLRCAEAVLGSCPASFVSPLAPDAENMTAVGAGPDCIAAGARLDERLRGRRMILRVDRIELSKNLLRGFQAFDELLRERPEWIGQVVFVALVYPSRESLPEYRAYRRAVESLVNEINDRWEAPGWTPILLDTSDDFPRSVAALRRYDVLLVNPIRDGLNLVAKEGPLVNRNDGVLVLSREAGVWHELSGSACEVNPFDVAGTAAQLARALGMGPAERKAHAAALRVAASSRTPRDWLEDQLVAARSAH